jgi:hypothetical protein
MSKTNSVSVRIACTSCHRAVNLECEGPPGFWGYQTYNEYFCPVCRKQNHARTPGAVVSARAEEDDARTPADEAGLADGRSESTV